ncbi:MAG: sensor domain-containing diguanylate cyclase [Planctomycetales bacterium]|nr:sensor domain-containing diguanylate cyclase [bacterium]UNM07597.1 MAG: sensor domain-containing diguanylate cyclase [Planctomycetales bacterium]
MNSPARTKKVSPGKAIRELCLRIAAIDPGLLADPDAELLELISQALDCPRVSLLQLDKAGAVIRMSTHGFTLKETPGLRDAPIVSRSLQNQDSILVADVAAETFMVEETQARYRTGCFAVYPIVAHGFTAAVLCLSDMMPTAHENLSRSSTDINLLLAMLGQYAIGARRGAGPEPSGASLSDDELGTLLRLVEKLDHSLDTRNIFASFCEITSALLPMDAMLVIHDSLDDDQRGNIVVQRPLHYDEIKREYGNLCNQWERRHSRSISIENETTSLVGKELLKYDGDCPDELRCGSCETFPVFIDNDLFALVSISAPEETITDRRRLKLFSILAHHLMLHIKKGLLMMQNQEMQTVDSLTGLYNERQFYKMMEREFDRACRYNVPLCLLIVDVDHFRDVNETYGFETGDMLLKEISAIIMENVRSTDFVSRYSGERFVVVLPETHNKNAEILANRLRRFVENNSFFISNTNVFIKVTVSIGVSSYLDHKPANLAQFIEFADTALFFSKRNGRNQVVGYSYVINLMMRDTDNES